MKCENKKIVPFLLVHIAATALVLIISSIFHILYTPQETLAQIIKMPQQTASGLIAFENSTLGIRIYYPDFWNKEQTDNKVIFHPPLENRSSKYTEKFEISIRPAENLSLNETTKRVLNGYDDTLHNFELVNSNFTRVNGIAAQIIIYTYNDLDSSLIKSMDVIMTDNINNYVLSYDARVPLYITHLPTIYQMIDSLKIVSSSNVGVYLQDMREASEPPTKMRIPTADSLMIIGIDPQIPDFLVQLMGSLNEEEIMNFDLELLPSNVLGSRLSELSSQDLIKLFKKRPMNESVRIFEKIDKEKQQEILDKLDLSLRTSITKAL